MAETSSPVMQLDFYLNGEYLTMIESAFMYAPGVFAIPYTEGLDRTVVNLYIAYLKRHITAVREAGKRIGVPEAQLDSHDKSKFGEAEFPAYAKHFYGGGAPKEFAAAVLHHYHVNAHHPEHWLFPGNSAISGVTVNNALPMPYHYIQEMAADWLGAQYALSGTWDISPWFNKNAGKKIILHPDTWRSLADVLATVGYSCRFFLSSIS